MGTGRAARLGKAKNTRCSDNAWTRQGLIVFTEDGPHNTCSARMNCWRKVRPSQVPGLWNDTLA